jgi:5-methylcytosine-specific restriction endonuclease McrA
MPPDPSRPCKRPGCPGFTTGGTRYCAAHQPLARAEIAATRAHLDARRGTAHARGYDGRWSDLSRQLRTRYPFSCGYLTRTAFWTPAHAMEFHALREWHVSRGRYLEFMRQVAADWSLHPQLSTLNSCYHFHPSPQPEPVEVTDHIIPHRGEPALFWAEWNLQTLSKRQHDTKTATEDGGFRGAPSSAKDQETKRPKDQETSAKSLGPSSLGPLVPYL